MHARTSDLSAILPCRASRFAVVAAIALPAVIASVATTQAAEWRRLLPGTNAGMTADAVREGDDRDAPAREQAVQFAVARPTAAVRLVAAAETETKSAAGRCEREAKDCDEALALLRADTLDRINLDIRVSGLAGNDYPCECRLEGETYEPRRFAATMFTWKAAGYCHKPLYFEDWALERYGHSHGTLVDPFVSAAHFFVTLPVLPYKVGVELPWECVYPLGYYRPGSCAPWTVPAVPISGRGFAMEAATLTGFLFVLP